MTLSQVALRVRARAEELGVWDYQLLRYKKRETPEHKSPHTTKSAGGDNGILGGLQAGISF